MMRAQSRLWKPVRILIALAVTAMLATACGDEEETLTEPPFPPKSEGDNKKADLKKKIKKKKKRKGEVDPSEFVAKAEWDMLMPHFDKFVDELAEQVHSNSISWKYKDAFADRTEKFYPTQREAEKPAFDLAKAVAEVDPAKEKNRTVESILEGILPPDAEGEGLADNGENKPEPLVRHSLDKYIFRIIMTGVANPEALVEDPEGNTYVLHLNDKIGSEGGHVVDIFKHKVLVRIPDREAPIELTLAPDTLPESFLSP